MKSYKGVSCREIIVRKKPTCNSPQFPKEDFGNIYFIPPGSSLYQCPQSKWKQSSKLAKVKKNRGNNPLCLYGLDNSIMREIVIYFFLNYPNNYRL